MTTQTKKGTIIKWFDQRGFGFIQPEGTKERSDQLFVHHSNIQVPLDQIQEGLTVEFEAAPGRKGLEARNVRRPGAATAPPLKGYRFLNPYNFVRYLPYREALSTDPSEVRLMGRAEPPGHDRWVGLSGQIDCLLKVVTPLFISDAEDVQMEKEIGAKKKHFSYRFFRVGGEKAIPASSLRGITRSVFEAVTNSAFSNLGGERLSYRLSSSEVQKLVPARIEKDEQEKWILRLLPGTAPFAPEKGQKKGLYAAPARFYKAVKPTGRRRREPPNPIGEPDQWEHSQPYFAVLRKMKFPPSWRVMDLCQSREAAEKRRSVLMRESRAELIVQSGWLCKTNQNSDNKNSERFFFREPGRRDVPETIPLPNIVKEKYEALIKDYQNRHQAEVKKRRHPDKVENREIAFSRFILDEREAKVHGGELVYTRLRHNLQVDFIAPVSWPRVAYDHTIAKLLPDYLHSPKDLDRLDPASRMFGWVRSEGNEKDGAYAGRVRFSRGRLQKAGKVEGEKTLAILGSPKPTTARFYLVGPEGEPSRTPQDDITVGYDGNNGHNRLRGRKFFRHFIPKERHMTLSEKSDQNRTIRDAEGPGAVFTFTLEFENLAPVELGALLWSLTLDGKGYHKLGYGKPLGLGSVEIQIDKVVFCDMPARYQSVDDDGTVTMGKSVVNRLVADFREAMCRYNVVNEEILEAAAARGDSGWQIVFEDLPNIKDVFSLLGKKQPDMPVHYPYSPDPNSQGQFEWFVGNNRLNGPRIELGLAHNDFGLPLIDKKGTEH